MRSNLQVKKCDLKVRRRGSQPSLLVRTFRSFTKCPISIVGSREAEVQKYMHNIFNACKITFFNEMRLVCQGLGITNVQQILDLVVESAEGVWNPFYGVRDLGPFDGECLPKDIEAFLSLTKHEGIATFIIPGILWQNKYYQALKDTRE
jgi:UDP-glucose 6-dehydrogenase